MTASANSKLARYRQLMDAKRLLDEVAGEDGGPPLPRSAPKPTAAVAQRSAGSAKSWPARERPTAKEGGAALNLNAELELERGAHNGNGNDNGNAGKTTSAVSKNDNGGKTAHKGGAGGNAGRQRKKKENLCPNNLSAMKQIMKKKQLAKAARKKLEAGAGGPAAPRAVPATVTVAVAEETKPGEKSEERPGERSEEAPGNNNNAAFAPDGGDASASDWAMLGNHLDESTLDQDQSSDRVASPASWKRDVRHELSSHSADGTASGASGVLSLLGASPTYAAAAAGADEAERNLSRSAEKVERLEERLLRGSRAEGANARASSAPEGGGGEAVAAGDREEDGTRAREKEVTFAEGSEGLKTPRGGGGPGRSAYRKSPYVAKSPHTDDKNGGLMMTPLSTLNESMESPTNPRNGSVMNESVIVSDDEALGENNLFGASPSPIKGTGGNGVDYEDGSDDTSESWSKEFGDHLNDSVENFDDVGSSKIKGPGKQRHHRSDGSKPAITPIKASLMERNQTLTKEIRFADQTCVELSERKKYYKIQAGQVKKELAAVNEESSLLRENYESSLQETAQLKVLVESLRAQKHQADAQVEAYRTQINDAERTHQSGLEKMEETYRSHRKNSEEQIHSLNERLHQSLSANANLQAKLDEKWESKFVNDAASQELVTQLKERVAAGDAAASAAEAARTAAQARIADLQALHDLRADELRRERDERKMIEHDRDGLRAQCKHLHAQLTEWVQASDTLSDIFFNDDGSRNEDFLAETLKEHTPVKRLYLDSTDSNHADAVQHPRTPTSNLLARTLRSELKRRHTVSEKLDCAEHRVAKLKKKLSVTKMDVEEAKADNALLEEDLEEKCTHIAKLEGALEEKDELIARLNEEIEVCFRMEGPSASAAASVESSSTGVDERETVSVLEERLEAVEDSLSFADRDLVENRARLACTQDLLDQRSDELEQSEQELAEAQDQLANCKTQIDGLQKFRDSLKEKLSESSAANADLRTQLNSCFQSLCALEKILRTYEDTDWYAGQQMAHQSRKVARLLETIERFAKERAPQNQDVESGALELSFANGEERAQSGLGDFASTTTSSSLSARNYTWSSHNEQELIQLRDDISTLEMERDDANKQLQKAHGFLQEFRDELSKQESEHLVETASLKKQCEELEAKLSAVNSDLRRGRETRAAMENDVSQQLSVIRSNNAELIQENESLRVDLQSLELQVEDGKALLRATREEADGYRQDVSNAKAAFECLTTECDLTKASLAELEKEAHVMSGNITQKEEDLKQCQARLLNAQESFQEQKADLEAKSSSLESDLNKAEASLDGASKRIAMLEDAAKINEKNYQEKLQLQIEETSAVVIELKEAQKTNDDAEKKRAEAASRIAWLEGQVDEKSSALFAYEEAIIGYKDDIRRLNNENQTTIQEKNNRIQMLEQGLSSRQTLFTEQLDRTRGERDAATVELTQMIERLQNELQASNKSRQEYGERAKLATQELEGELFKQKKVQKDLEEELIQNQARLEEETLRHGDACKQLEEARTNYDRVMDRYNLLEMDFQRMLTRNQDEGEELKEERNRAEDKTHQLEEQKQLLQANIQEYEEMGSQQQDEIARLSAQNASLQKKCNLFKVNLKGLAEKNQAWEDSYKAQSDDLVQHGMEISRLNGRVSDLKSRLIREGSDRHADESKFSSSPRSESRGRFTY